MIDLTELLLLPERFTDKIEVDIDSGCWLWTAYKTKAGYGQFSFEGKAVYSHRFSYQNIKGFLDENSHLDHYHMNPGNRNNICSRHCCNPQHLEEVTSEVNKSRGYSPAAINSRKTTCNKGHEFSGTYTTKTGKVFRTCNICNTRRNRNRYL